MIKRILILTLVLILASGGLIAWKYLPLRADKNTDLVLYGNIDDRQINLAFNISERITEILVEEGNTVKKGQLLGRLETVRIKNAIASAEAALEASAQNYERVKNGPRKEDIEIARANVAEAQASYENAEKDYLRQKSLAKSSAVSVQLAELAETKYLMTKAELNAAKKQLELLLAGSRVEDIAEAKAKVAQQKAELRILEQQLADTQLFAPSDGIVRNRLLEPGEMTGPLLPVLTISLIDPRWVRTYVPETLLSHVKNGETAEVTVDSLPGKIFEGWVGFVSPTAEFTPKNVETVELRTALVYEVRVFVKDPENLLKLGSPATVRFKGKLMK